MRNAASACAHGYYKIANKPLMTLVHGTVGLQHATMTSTTPIATACR